MWLTDLPGYLPPVQIDEVVRSGGIGKIIESKNENFSKGDLVSGMIGWQTHHIPTENDLKTMRKVPDVLPIPTMLNIFGSTGITAYFGLLDVGNPQPGETVVVSGAAGATGAMVCQIAKIKGFHVIGIAGGDEKCSWLKDCGVDDLIDFKGNSKIVGKGPVGKFFSSEACEKILELTNSKIGDSIFMSCGQKKDVEKILSLARNKIAEDLNLISNDIFSFCWIVDYPMYEIDEKTKKIKFSHNPFSMPQGEIKDIDFSKPLEMKAYQYDIVCNGIELSSGAIRNHIPELMYKLFEIAGYKKKDVDNKFSGMINALSYGAPPHGGIAPGIDRIVMLLANEANIREVTMFPMNQNAQDLMMSAPSEVSEDQLKELQLSIAKKK